MFSNIQEAWSQDPVKEMTSRLNRGEFKTENDFANSFKFKDHNNNTNNNHCGMRTNESDKINITSTALKDSIRSANDQTLSLTTSYPGMDSYAPVNFKKNRKTDYNFLSSDENSMFGSDSAYDSKCSYSVKHLKKCGKCYRALMKLVEKKIKKKIDDVVIDMKFKQLQTQHINNQPQQSTTSTNTSMSDSWKEILILVFGIIITMFLLFLIARSLWK
jgi:hypothetical protein